MRWNIFVASSMLLAASATATPLQRRDGGSDKPVCEAFLPTVYDAAVKNCLVSTPTLSPAAGNQSSDELGYIPLNPFCSPANGTRICGPNYNSVVWSPQPLHRNSTVIVTTTAPALSPPIFDNPNLLRSLDTADSSRLVTYINFTAPDFAPTRPEVPIQLFLIEVYNATDETSGQLETRQRIFQGPMVTLVWYPNAKDDQLNSQIGHDEFSVGAVAGLVFGLLALFGVLVWLTCYCWSKRSKAKRARVVDSGAEVSGLRGWFGGSRAQETARVDEVPTPVIQERVGATTRASEPENVVMQTKAYEDHGPSMPPPTYNEAVRGEASRLGAPSSPGTALDAGTSIMDRGRGY